MNGRMRGKLAFALAFTIIIAIAVSMGGCTSIDPYAEIGMGHNTSLFNEARQWDNSGMMGTTLEAGVESTILENPNLTGACRWLHVSQFGNVLAESSLDHFGCSIRFTWR